MLTIHHLSTSLACPLFAKVHVAYKTTQPLAQLPYLLVHCLGIKPTIYAERVHGNLIFGTRLEAIKNQTVGSPEKFQMPW